MFSKGRRPDRVSAQAIIQVAAKAALLDFTAEILIGCGNQAYIYIDRLCSSDSLEVTFLQDALKHRLALSWQIIDLIEKQCSSVCLLKAADLARASSHKRLFLVPEQEEESDCEHHVRSVLPSRRAVNRKQRRKQGDKCRRENPQHDSIGYEF